MMHDPNPPFSSIWKDKLAQLPKMQTVALKIEPNTPAEKELGCMICNRPGPCEWIVTMKTSWARLWRGLCEDCRSRSHAP